MASGGSDDISKKANDDSIFLEVQGEKRKRVKKVARRLPECHHHANTTYTLLHTSENNAQSRNKNSFTKSEIDR